MSFGENLKNVRKQRNITQEELAETLADVEKNSRDCKGYQYWKRAYCFI